MFPRRPGRQTGRTRVGRLQESYSKRCLALSAASVGALAFGWFWVAANFSAREAAWWNSLWTICGIFAIGTVSGLESRRGMPWLGRGTVLWVFPALNALSLLMFVELAF